MALSVIEREIEILSHIHCLFYTFYARGELGLRTHRLSDSCSFAMLARAHSFGCRFGGRDGSQGKSTEDLTLIFICEEFKSQRERSSVKQHTEATKQVSAQRGLTWLQNAVPQLIRQSHRVAHMDALSKPVGSSLQEEGVRNTVMSLSAALRCCAKPYSSFG